MKTRLPVDHFDRATFAANMLFGGAAEENFPRKMPADAWFGFKGCDRFRSRGAVLSPAWRRGSDRLEAAGRGRGLTREH
jgi:hypothetical protein